jgi:hypothetical protein
MCKLAGRRQNECQREFWCLFFAIAGIGELSRGNVRLQECFEDRDSKCKGFSRTCTSLSNQIVASEDLWNSGGLDGCR